MVSAREGSFARKLIDSLLRSFGETMGPKDSLVPVRNAPGATWASGEGQSMH